jgi:hypothetical protein
LGTRQQEKAKLLWLKKQVTAGEAPYLVMDKLGGMYDDALSLVIEAITDQSLPAVKVIETRQDYLGRIFPIEGSIDRTKTTISTIDLLAWLTPLIEVMNTDSQSAVNKETIEKLPSNAIGKLAVKAAKEIEAKEERKATDNEVMSLLQNWADNGTEPATLKESKKINRAVIWITNKGTAKEYSMEACQKTLESWNKSRG